MPTPIENARKRLAALRVEIAGVERFIEMYERFSDVVPSAVATASGANSAETKGENSFSVDNSASVVKNGPRPRELAEMMERMIREVGRPMTRGEIVDAFDRRDVEIPAKDKSRYLGTIAWRNKSKFINIEGLGYWVRGEPMPPGSALLRQVASEPPEEYSDELMED